MKKLHIISLLLIGMAAFTACEEQDASPTYQEPAEFVLNTPAYVNTLYDLENSEALILTCSQPDYGFTAAVKYAVEVSMGTTFSEENFAALGTTYSTARMSVDAAELAAAITSLATESGVTEDEFPIETAICVRLRASLATSGKGEIVSNSVLLPNVRCHFALPPVDLPENMYMNGSMCSADWNWGDAYDMVPVNGVEGYFWRMAYIPDGGAFKFNYSKAWDGNEFGYAGATVSDNAGAGVSSSDDGNFVVANGGWYLVSVKTGLDGRNYTYNVVIDKPNVYAIGLAAPVTDWTINDANLYEVPSDADGFFKSPVLAADFPGNDTDGCLRACVKLADVEWWQTEFMVFDGILVYRGNGGDQERVGGKTGQSLYINFTSGTGKIE